MKYPLIAVSAAILDGKGKILLTKRSENVQEPHKWCLPGGHLEGGQTWEAAARAEVLEETGLVPGKLTLMGIYSDPTWHTLETPGGILHYLTACFLVSDVSGELRLNEEVSEFGWFTPALLPSVLLKSERVKIDDAFAFTNSVFVR